MNIDQKKEEYNIFKLVMKADAFITNKNALKTYKFVESKTPIFLIKYEKIQKQNEMYFYLLAYKDRHDDYYIPVEISGLTVYIDTQNIVKLPAIAVYPYLNLRKPEIENIIVQEKEKQWDKIDDEEIIKIIKKRLQNDNKKKKKKKKKKKIKKEKRKKYRFRSSYGNHQRLLEDIQDYERRKATETYSFDEEKYNNRMKWNINHPYQGGRGS